MNPAPHPAGRRVTAAFTATTLVALGLIQGVAVVAQSPGQLTVDGAWARTSPMVDRAGAAYMVIHNNGTTDDALMSVTSPAATTVELHQTMPNASGEMMMQPVASIPVPAGGSAELKPGSYHMMLIGLAAPLTAGSTIELTLTFQSGSTLTVSAPVGEGMPGPMPSGSVGPMGFTPLAAAS